MMIRIACLAQQLHYNGEVSVGDDPNNVELFFAFRS